MLLGMTRSTVDEVVAKFNGDFLWKDPRLIAQVVVTVAGGRKNGPELIEFMQKISDTRGYSSIMLKIGEVEKMMESPLTECGFSDVIDRVCKMPIDDPKRTRDLAISEVGPFIRSAEFPVRAAISELIPLVDAVTKSLEEGESGGGQGMNSLDLKDLSEKDGGYASIRKAVDEAAGFEFSVGAVTAAAEAAGAGRFAREAGTAGASVSPALVPTDPVVTADLLEEPSGEDEGEEEQEGVVQACQFLSPGGDQGSRYRARIR
jgi:hypothetical protein